MRANDSNSSLTETISSVVVAARAASRNAHCGQRRRAERRHKFRYRPYPLFEVLKAQKSVKNVDQRDNITFTVDLKLYRGTSEEEPPPKLAQATLLNRVIPSHLCHARYVDTATYIARHRTHARTHAGARLHARITACMQFVASMRALHTASA